MNPQEAAILHFYTKVLKEIAIAFPLNFMSYIFTVKYLKTF